MITRYTINISKIGLMSLLLSISCLIWVSPAWTEPTHAIFEELLMKYNQNGWVDYAGFKKDEVRLDAYLMQLANIDPVSLSDEEQFAFYINAYNAWTIKLILSAYPGITSIKSLGSLFKSPWKKKIVKLQQGVVSLDHIEHEILRPKFQDPRVHFAINCASKGCPSLWPEPFVGSKLQTQLDAAAEQFINNTRYNRLKGDTLYVSRIFKWFRQDFNDDIIGYIEKYASPELREKIGVRKPSLQVEYLDYDWSLNGE